MSELTKIFRGIPYWAYLLVLIVIFINIVYLVYKWQIPEAGCVINWENGKPVHSYIEPGGSADKAGIKVGDVLVSVNSFTLYEWDDFQRPKAGDTIMVGLTRNNQELVVPLTFGMRYSKIKWFFISMFVILSLCTVASLYILYKKPRDGAVRLFFICLLCFAVTQNSIALPFQDRLSVFATVFWLFCICVIGPILVHFHLLFPRPSKIILRFPRLQHLFYLAGILIFLGFSITFILCTNYGYNIYGPAFYTMRKCLLWFTTLSYSLAMAIAIYQFHNIKDTLSRNQIRIVIIGTFFALVSPIGMTFFDDYIRGIEEYYPYFTELFSGAGFAVMVICFLIAIFRYRIWNTEIFIRNTILYLGATILITISYLLMIFLVNLMTIRQTNFVHFIILAISILLFLVLRDRIQRLIDRLFHRESYDSATVVSDFEKKLAGVYQPDLLKQKISLCLDEIFHFKSFIFFLKKNQLLYEPAYVMGTYQQDIDTEIKASRELEKKLEMARVFSPEELDRRYPAFETVNCEIMVPLLSGNQSAGFFVCGQKKSGKVYSLQDIRVLNLLSRRVTAMLHTASLYQKDLDRQLMLERERARISADMHDDVGASLTRISILSELAKNSAVIEGEAKQWLGQINDTSRGVMEEMNQIIWALNPRNDTLEGLVAYIRRFASEYLEPTSLKCRFDFPEALPSMELSVEVRRNLYLCVREALHNVVKHSGASEVMISLQKNEHRFRLTVKDDGTGFSPENLSLSGNGLVNMKKRMNDIGGDIQISSIPGEGTKILFIV